MNKKSRAVYHRIQFDIDYPSPRTSYAFASDDTGKSLELVRIDSSRTCSPPPCSEHETLGVSLDEAILRQRAATGYQVQVRARNGTKWALLLTPQMIQAQLAAFDKLMADLNGARKAAAPAEMTY